MELVSADMEKVALALSDRIREAKGWDASCEKAASDYAFVLAEAGAERGDIVQRLRAMGISRRGAAKLLSEAERRSRERENSKTDRELDGATPVCPHCLHPLDPLDHFCPRCRGPVTAHASIDPMGQIFSTGRAYRSAVSGRPRTVVLAGMWLIFGSSLGYLLFCLHLGLRAVGAYGPQTRASYVESDGLAGDLLKLALVLALIALHAAILWKVTVRWARSRGALSP